MSGIVIVLIVLILCFIFIKIYEYRVNQEWTSTRYGIKEYKGKAYRIEELNNIILFKKVYNKFTPYLIHTKYPNSRIRVFIVKKRTEYASSLFDCKVKFMGYEDTTFKVVDVNYLGRNKLALSVVDEESAEKENISET